MVVVAMGVVLRVEHVVPRQDARLRRDLADQRGAPLHVLGQQCSSVAGGGAQCTAPRAADLIVVHQPTSWRELPLQGFDF